MKYLIDETTLTGIADAIRAKNGSSDTITPGQMKTAIESMSGGGQYCWAKYAMKKSYEITKEALGTTEPDDCGTTDYKAYTVTDDGYFQLSSSSDVVINYYHLPSGATNGQTKCIYYEAWGYSANTYQKWTLSDTYTEEKGDLIGYVTSDDSSAYPADGVSDDGYWYVSVGQSDSSEDGGGNVETPTTTIETFHVTSLNDTITPTISGTVKVYGYGYYSASNYSKTNRCFVGDGYYTPSTSSFGGSSTAPSKTSATFSIDSDGKLSGLPDSTYTTLDLLVTIGEE